MKKISITDALFELFPDFYRGIVLVKDVTNQKSYKRIRKLLRGQIEAQAEIDTAADARLVAWDQAHRKFGSDPGRHPPAIRSLLERIQANQNLPFINSVVALFNYTSLKYVLPCGGDDVDRVDGNLVLGIADGNETFLPLGGSAEDPPVPGEVIYFDDVTRNVMCRRWNWRNGETTKIEVESKKLVINVDGLPPTTPQRVDQARDELAELLREHCQADVETLALHVEQRQIDLPFA
jgi:lysyl-tRNA synthetase class 2